MTNCQRRKSKRQRMETRSSIKGLSHNLGLLATTFNIRQQTSCSTLDKWLNVEGQATEQELALLNEIHAQVVVDGRYWNEEELKLRLVSLLFFIAKIDVIDRVKVFYERAMKGTIESYDLSVVTDCLVATPAAFNTPQKPYFFLQEYKRSKGDSKDPEAQMLSAMLIAQEQNQDQLPVYGSYIVGTNWYFTTLLGKDYCCSREYDVVRHEDILAVVLILRKLRDMILIREKN